MIISVGTCADPAPLPIGWWMGGATVATNQSVCVSEENRAAGVRYASYLSAPGDSLPHNVWHHNYSYLDSPCQSLQIIWVYSKFIFYYMLDDWIQSDFGLSVYGWQ